MCGRHITANNVLETEIDFEDDLICFSMMLSLLILDAPTRSNNVSNAISLDGIPTNTLVTRFWNLAWWRHLVADLHKSNMAATKVDMSWIQFLIVVW